LARVVTKLVRTGDTYGVVDRATCWLELIP